MIRSGPGITKLFTAVIFTNVRNNQVFIPCTSLQLSLMYACKAVAYSWASWNGLRGTNAVAYYEDL
jgi:hypothetical protein